MRSTIRKLGKGGPVIKRTKLGLAIATIFVAHMADAAEFFRLPNSDALAMLGRIEVSDISRLEGYFEAGIEEMYLSSPGGDLDAAWELGSLVQKHQVKITLTKDVTCSSACAILFLHSPHRLMESNSQIGLHLPYFNDITLSQQSEVCEAIQENLSLRSFEVASSISEIFPSLPAASLSYQNDPSGFEYNASHILVATEGEAIQLKIEIDDGADFSQSARDNSTGPSGPSGGELGWFGPGVMVPPFEKAVFALEVGEVSNPVQTLFGWHLIKLNQVRPPVIGLPGRRGQVNFSSCLTLAYQLGAHEFLRISDLLSQANVDGSVLRAMISTPSNAMFWLDENMANEVGMTR